MTNIPQTPYKIGITGTIASGKTLVGRYLVKSGVPVLDTDDVVAKLYREDTALQREVSDAFGPNALNPKGQVDKDYLKQFVFIEKEKRKLLESLVHPRVHQAVKAFLTEPNPLTPIRAVLVPLLFESGTEKSYDEVWTVKVAPEKLLTRLMKRNGLTREEAERRVAAQMSQDEKVARAQRIIDNSSTRAKTKAQVVAALDSIRKALSLT